MRDRILITKPFLTHVIHHVFAFVYYLAVRLFGGKHFRYRVNIVVQRPMDDDANATTVITYPVDGAPRS